MPSLAFIRNCSVTRRGGGGASPEGGFGSSPPPPPGIPVALPKTFTIDGHKPSRFVHLRDGGCGVGRFLEPSRDGSNRFQRFLDHAPPLVKEEDPTIKRCHGMTYRHTDRYTEVEVS